MWEREDLIGTSIAPAPHSPGDPSLAAASPGSGGVTIIAPIPLPVDVTDRVGRLLGVLASITAPVDVSDRAGRLVGVVNDGGGSLTVDTPQLPAALVAGRLDENIGAWLGSVAPTVGQKAMAASLPIAIASDQASYPVKLGQDFISTFQLLQPVGNFTTAQTSAIQTSDGYKGVAIRLLIVTNPGGGQTLALSVDVANTGFFNYCNFIAVTADALWLIYPGITAADFGGTATKGLPIPGRWRTRLVPSGAGIWSVQLDYQTII